MPYFEHDQRQLYFDVHGKAKEEAPCVLLIHSFLCSSEMWRHQIAALSPKFHVIVMDLRGHGKSGAVNRHHSMYDLLGDAIALLDHCDISSAFWGGLSIGGMITLRAALKYPSRVSGMMLLDTHAGPETQMTKLKYALLAKLVRAKGVEAAVKPISRLMFGKTTFQDRQRLLNEWIEKFKAVDVNSVLEVRVALVQRDDLRAQLSELKQPALVMCGVEDKALPIKYSREIHRHLSESRMIDVNNAGHLISLEQPNTVSKAMISFLEANASSN